MEYKKINYRGAIVEVSRSGQVKVDGKIKNQFYNKDGYVCVSLHLEKYWSSVGVHRLVATAFVPNPDNLNEVNHKDYKRDNNNADNLEWITHADNIRYSICNMPDVHGENNPNYGNNTLHLKYLNDPEYALEKQSRKGLQNGRCQKIELYYDGVLEKTFPYMVECCKYVLEKYSPNVKNFETIRGQINVSIRKNKPYKKHLTFKKIA